MGFRWSLFAVPFLPYPGGGFWRSKCEFHSSKYSMRKYDKKRKIFTTPTDITTVVHTPSAKMRYHRVGNGGEGKEREGKTAMSAGLLRGRGKQFGGGGRGQLVVYMSVSIEMRKNQCVDVSEGCEKVVGAKSCGGLRICGLTAASPLACTASRKPKRAVPDHNHHLAY